MAKDKISKATAVKSILSDLKKGIDKEIILRRIANKCDKNRATIYRWYSVAEKEYLEFNKKVAPIKEKAEEEAIYEATKEIIKNGILSRAQRMKILSEIAIGQTSYKKEIPTKFGVEIINEKPTYSDRRAVIAELNKMAGDYAPIKTDLTSKGDKLKSETSIIQIEIINPLEDED